MTSSDFRAALEFLSITNAAFAPMIGKSERTVRRYAAGDKDVPKLVADRLADMMKSKKRA